MDGDAMSVYGLAVTGLGCEVGAFGVRSASDGPPGMPVLHVQQRLLTDHVPRFRSLNDHAAEVPLIESSWLSISRGPAATATFQTTRVLDRAELLHPWLVPAAATVNVWNGRKVFHGGIVSDGECAVAIVGGKEAGKSSLLAWASAQPDLFVMADDLVVADGRTIFAGPSTVDLRLTSLAHLPNGTPGSCLVRGDTRARLVVPSGPPTAHLVGVVVLTWSTVPALELRPVQPADRLGHLLPHAMIGALPLGHAGVLDIVRYPTWQLSRPRDWVHMPEALTSLRSILSSAGARP